MNAAAGAAGALTFTRFAQGMALYGAAQVVVAIINEWQNYRVADMIVNGIRQIYRRSFEHMHRLDLGFHRAKSKDTVFEINDAVRELDVGLYYLFADILRYAFRLCFIAYGMKLCAGVKYARFMFGAFGTYLLWTMFWTPRIAKMFRKEKDLWKRHEGF